MKKLPLVLPTILLGALAAVAGETPISKDKIIAPAELFHAHELQFGVFGAAAFGQVDYHNHSSTSTTTTQTVVQPPVPVATPAPTPIPEGLVKNSTTTTTTTTQSGGKVTTTTTTNTKSYRQTSIRGYGGGIETNYFFTRYLGIGVEGEWLASDSAINSVGGSFIARYPFEHGTWGVAPYGFAGGGGQFDGMNVGYGFFGGGAEVRFSPKWGIFADGRWTIHDRYLNYALVRTGVRFLF